MKYAIIATILIIAAFAGGIYFAPYLNPEITAMTEQTQENQSAAGLLPVNMSIDGISVSLTNGCNALQFNVTEDQAFSISRGIEGSIGFRPLTHDIFKDVLENFGIKVTQIKIDRFEDDIFKARIIFKQGDKVLDADLRPSDAIAMAARLNKTLYVDEGVMSSKSVNIC